MQLEQEHTSFPKTGASTCTERLKLEAGSRQDMCLASCLEKVVLQAYSQSQGAAYPGICGLIAVDVQEGTARKLLC